MKKFLSIYLCAMGLISIGCNELDKSYIGPSEITVENGVMTPEVLLSFGRLSDPQLSPDGSHILYGVSYTSISENRSCRNLYICDTDGANKVQLTASGRSILCARWFDGGKSILYIQGGQIYKAPFKGNKLGQAKKISDIPEGISEFSLSPDGKHIIYVSTVPSNVKTPSDTDPALDKAQAYVTEDLMYRHWDHWVTSLPHSYVAPVSKINVKNSTDILGGADVKFELPFEPFGGVEQLSWSPDSKYIAYSCKKLGGKEYAFSTNTEIFIYNVKTAQTSIAKVGGGYDTDPVFSPDGKSLAWLSMARDGYEADKVRILCGDFAEGEVSNIRELTSDFKYNAAGLSWADDSHLYFNSLVEGLQGIFSIDIRTKEVLRLTDADLWFDFSTPFAVLEDGTLLAQYDSMEFPNELVAVKDGKPLQITHENEHILSQLEEYKTEKRYVTTTDGQQMLTWVLFPPKFDETKTYPAIEIFLGGPQGTLSQGWSFRWNYRLMAAQGYIVVLPNRRGTTAFGQEWCEQISGDYIGQNMQDYLSAAQMIKTEPYVGKLAGCGASYGGFSVYYMAGIHENTYDCFIAHAGIFDETYMYYETEEMWFPNWDNGGLEEYAYRAGEMGPRGDGVTFGGMKQAGSPWSVMPKAQRHYANSPSRNVAKWNTPIMCIHGMMDFRIPYDQGMAAFNAAQMMGVPSKLVVFPEENHWILQPQNALFWHREYFGWLDKWCK